jgi:hypothetical protein
LSASFVSDLWTWARPFRKWDSHRQGYSGTTPDLSFAHFGKGNAGPTGLTLAVDLGLRGISCTIIEQKEAPQFLPKMERCNARSMRVFLLAETRLRGWAERIRTCKRRFGQFTEMSDEFAARA